ncbi:MAG: transporter substrate-binding domain-containing protein [Cellulosilyticaceae bacterium]
MRKKIYGLIMIMSIFSVMTGCATQGNTSNTENENVLRVAMDLKYPPLTGMDAEGNPEGLEVDLARAFGEYVGKEVEIINTDFSMLIVALETGDADIVIGDMTIKEERKEKVDFSDPYLYGRTLALINKEFAETHNITDEMSPEELFAIEELKTVGLSGTISVNVPNSYGVEVQEMNEMASALMEVNNGTSNILVGTDSILGDHAAYPNTTIVYNGIPEYSAVGMAVKKGNTELLEQANKFVATMYEEGGFYVEAGDKYDEVIGKYLQDATKGLSYKIYPPKNAKQQE